MRLTVQTEDATEEIKRKSLQNQKNNIRDDCSDYYQLGKASLT